MDDYLEEFERTMLRGERPLALGPAPEPAPGPSNIPFEVQEEAERITLYVCLVWLVILAYCIVNHHRERRFAYRRVLV
jgi:hypothetical protein